MKAERRHELQDNDLTKVIKGLPTFWEVYGNRIMIGLILVTALIWALRWRVTSGRESVARAHDALAVARASINDLSGLPVLPAGSAATAQMRAQLITDVRSALEVVNRETTDRALQAEALVCRGDLNWLVANLPALPGAATQPALRPDATPEQALKGAEEAYNQLLAEYADQNMSVTSARFGLAAIAENRGHWDRARQLYQAIIADAGTLNSFKDQAQARAQLLDRLAKAVYIAPTLQPTTHPAATTPALPAPAPTAEAPAPAPAPAPALAADAPAPAPATPSATTPANPAP